MTDNRTTELREKALLFEGYNNGEISRMLREAADTIESLRERLQDAVVERGECELSSFADVCFNVEYEVEGYDMDSGKDYATLAECSECGAYVIVPPAHHHVLTCDGDEVYSEYTCCPVCRKAVTR